jgi:hypothetical protein
MHKIIESANVINSSAVDNPCGDTSNMEDMGILSDGILRGIKVGESLLSKSYFQYFNVTHL